MPRSLWKNKSGYRYTPIRKRRNERVALTAVDRMVLIMKEKSDGLKEQNSVHDQDQLPTYESGPAAF